jgi:hypothetical protein
VAALSAAHIAAMPPERPPEVDAEYRLVRGPWPRWMLHIGLFKLAITGAVAVAICILLAVAISLIARAL